MRLAKRRERMRQLRYRVFVKGVGNRMALYLERLRAYYERQ